MGGCAGDKICGDFKRTLGGGMVITCSLERGRVEGGVCFVGATTAAGLTLLKAEDVATEGLPVLRPVPWALVLKGELLVNTVLLEAGANAVNVLGFVGKLCPLGAFVLKGELLVNAVLLEVGLYRA